MEKINTQVNWSLETAVDLIRKLRNDLIKDFLDERNLITYFSTQFKIRELSAVKIEFIKVDLKKQLIEPVDTQHYQTLIQQILQTGTASITEKYEDLFLKDIERTLKKYNY